MSPNMEHYRFPEIPNRDDTALDWVYTRRREMQEILPRLYLGPYAAASKCMLNSLKKRGITHIVCIRERVEVNFIKPNFPEHFQYLVLEIADSVTENIIQHFPKVKVFLDICFQRGGQALVHGSLGISRSAALVVAYIMENFGMCYKESLQYVQQRRFCINPNEGFAQQLMEYEPIYRAKLLFQNGESSQVKGLLKRKREDENECTEEMDTNITS